MEKKKNENNEQAHPPIEGIDRREFLRKSLKGLKGFALIGLLASSVSQSAFATDSQCHKSLHSGYYRADSACGTSNKTDVDENCHAEISEDVYDIDDNCGGLNPELGENPYDPDGTCGVTLHGSTVDGEDECCGKSTFIEPSGDTDNDGVA